MKNTAIVILNWNGEKFLEKFLPVLIDNSPKEFSKIWIIDNASNDNSIEYINNNFPEIGLVQLDKNYGFTGGYNKGLKEIEADYYLILNSDIEVTPDWLLPLIDEMENNPGTGICGPKLLDYHQKDKFEYAGASGGFIDKYGYPFCRGRLFESLEQDSGQYDDSISCFWITGAALMIRTELFWELGGFDDSFFAHMEEIDLCWRAKNNGHKVVCVPKSIVYHVGGGTLPKANASKTYYNFKNNLSLLFKNLPSERLFRVFLARFFLDQLAAIRMILQDNFKHSMSVYKAYFKFSLSLLGLIKKRKKLNQKSLQAHDGFYDKSIVYQYFLKGINKFKDLPFF